MVERLVAWARERQRSLAQQEDAAAPDAWQERMRATPRAELAWGEAYQADYQAFEACALAAGHDLGAPGAYDAFFVGRPALATAPRYEDDLLIRSRLASSSAADSALLGGLGATIGMLFAALTDRRPRRRVRAMVRRVS